MSPRLAWSEDQEPAELKRPLTPIVAMMAVVINAATVPPIIRAITDAIIPRPIVRDRVWVRVIAVPIWIAVVARESKPDSYRNSSIRVGSSSHDEAERDQCDY